MTSLVPRTTLTQICAHRRRALELFADAHAALLAADQALTEAKKAATAAAPRKLNRFNYHSDDGKRSFIAGLNVPTRDDFLATSRHLIDIDVWAYLVELTDLERLMDKKAKDELNQQLLRDPPEATEENIVATIERLALDAGMIFRRGIAECFSALDRRFRSHDGWKIGNRVILDRAFDEWGSWNYHRNQRDTIQDIERTFFVLDGKTPPANYGGLVGAVENERRGGLGRRQSEVESEYFKLRCFKNGNAHVWFQRDDLLEKVNQLLGEYYGAPLPEERGPDEDTGLHTPKTSLAKNYGFFPTPDAAASVLIEGAPLYRRDGQPRPTVLEPSAGSGNLAALAAERGAIVDCVEIQPSLAERLRDSGKYRRVLQCDFLALQPDPARLYDLVVMNPPFDRERDIDHVMHALRFLKPSGFLTAIMSAATEFRDTKKSTAFRALMEGMKARWSDLPSGSFSSVGTNVNTVILRVWNDARQFW